MNQFNSTPQGWECPKCGRVYAPTQMMCIVCPTQTSTTTTLATSGTSSSTLLGHKFEPQSGKTSKTKCKICGLEKWQHPLISYT